MISPQLASTASVFDVNGLMSSNEWAAEEKFDGDRFLLVWEGQKVSAFSRKGTELVVPTNMDFSAPDSVVRWKLKVVLDGELMSDGRYMIFDLLELGANKLYGNPYFQRRETLEALIPLFDKPQFHVVESATGEVNKENLLDSVMANKGEGVIFKDISSRYVPGTRSKEWVKYKLYKTCSCFISDMNRGGLLEAATICVYDNKSIHELSGVKIPTRYQKEYNIKAGDVIEVKFLNLTPDNKLTQPTFVRKRTDVEIEDCTLQRITAELS